MELEITHDRTPTMQVIRLTGELVLSNAPELRRILETAINSSPIVGVDLKQVSFIDSTGLRTLFQLSEHLGARGEKLHLMGVSPFVRRLLDALRAWRFFCVWPELGPADEPEQIEPYRLVYRDSEMDATVVTRRWDLPAGAAGGRAPASSRRRARVPFQA